MSFDLPTVAAFTTIFVAIGFFFEYLEKTYTNSGREKFILVLTSVGNKPFSDILLSCNRFFLKIFDWIYSNANHSPFHVRPSDTEGVLIIEPAEHLRLRYEPRYRLSFYGWSWLTGMFIVAITVNAFFYIIGSSPPTLQNILMLGAITGCVYVCFEFEYERYYNRVFELKGRKLGLSAFSIITILALLFLVTVIWPMTQGRSFNLEFPNNLFVYLLFVSIPILFIHEFIYSFFGFINPFRAILTSFIAMLAIGLFKWPIVLVLLAGIKILGWPILGYVLLNVCVDAFSLLETRFALKLASTGSVIRFVGVLILDVVASAALFLAIPIASGHYSPFLDGIFFQGDQPWIGILFWSSFSTSFLFYLYLISALVLAFLHTLIKGMISLKRFLPVMEKPFRCLGLVAMLVWTGGFLILCTLI